MNISYIQRCRERWEFVPGTPGSPADCRRARTRPDRFCPRTARCTAFSINVELLYYWGSLVHSIVLLSCLDERCFQSRKSEYSIGLVFGISGEIIKMVTQSLLLELFCLKNGAILQTLMPSQARIFLKLSCKKRSF